jgi:hypothetical protein
MADKKIKVQVDVDTNIEPSIAALKQLKKQLKETAVGSAEFKRLSAQIRDVEDAIEGAKLGAEDLAGALEAAPGPVGQLFQGLKKVEIATKSWGAALKATGIGLIVSLVGGFAAALSKSDETMKKFEPILISFEQILNGVLGALEPLIDGFIRLATNVLPYVSKAFQVVYSAVTAVFQSLGKLGGAVVKLFRGDFKGAWEDAKASVTSFSDNYNTSVQRFEEGTKKITKTQKENLDKQKKDRDEAAEKLKQQREAELKELVDGQKDAMLELLSEREAEEFKVNEHYANLIYLATKYGDDTTQLKLAQINKLNEIDQKYRDKEKEKADKDAEEKKKKDEKELEERLKLAEASSKFQYELFEKIKKLEEERLDISLAVNRAIGQSWVDLGNNIAGTFGTLINVFEEGSEFAKIFGVIQVAISTAASIGSILLSGKQQQADYNKAIAAGNSTIGIGIANSFIPGMQAFAVGQIATGKAAVAGAVAGKAVAKTNTIAQVAAASVAGAGQIAAILSARKGSGATSKGGGGESGGSSTPALPSIPSVAAPQIQTTGGMNPTQQIGETLANAQAPKNAASSEPIKAYVVSGEISSQQALDRRTNRAATFAGG